MEERNQKIIDAIIQKAADVCPGALAMIGIYGSVLTGDIHEKSDLDLMILINDDRGWQLACTFIQDDLHVGHDIYCTTWESLQEDARYLHPNISKLMDSKIVYCADDAFMIRLQQLRDSVNEILHKPFSTEDYVKAENLLKEAEHFYTHSMTATDLTDIYQHTGAVLYYLECAIAMLNKTYFRYGTRRTLDELEAMEHRPAKLRQLIEAVISANSVPLIRQNLTELMGQTLCAFAEVRRSLTAPKQCVTENTILGTYEEMFSNWRNKVHFAAAENDVHLAFMSMSSTDAMLAEIAAGVQIDRYRTLDRFDPADLQGTAEAYDEILENYLKEYETAGISPKHHPNIDDFIKDYLQKRDC